MADYARTCPRCRLVYVPDPRIHENPEEYCPRCGFFLQDAENWKKREIKQHFNH